MGKNLKISLAMIEPPLPFGNAASRWFYVLLKGLVERGHRVQSFVAYSKENEREKTLKIFSPDQYPMTFYPFPQNRGLKGKLQSLLKPHSFKFSGDMVRDLHRDAETSDIVHIEQLWAGWTGLPFARKSLINVHHLQTIDLEEIRPDGWKQKLDFHLIFKTEKNLIRRYPFVRSCSPRLVPYMEKWHPGVTAQTVPVGIDPSLYEFIPDEKRSDGKTISLIGNMGWYPGQSAAFRLLDDLWPEIKKRVPEAKLQIVGWSARSVLEKYLNLPDVEIHENVPEIQPYFEGTSVMLYAPARGSGMKIKVLEAMAFGIPTVTTSEGAEGLPVVDGLHMGLREDNDGLIERTVHLLNQSEAQNEMRRKARQLLEEHCGPQTTLDQIEDMYEKILGR